MNRFFAVVGLAIVLAMLGAPVALGDTLATKTAPVSLTILPYAEVLLAQTNVAVELPPAGPATVNVDIAGSVICNTGVSLFARVTKPAGAPGTWTASADPEGSIGTITTAGTYQASKLLRITVVLGSTESGGEFGLAVSGQSSTSESAIPAPPAGTATLTVVPG